MEKRRRSIILLTLGFLLLFMMVPGDAHASDDLLPGDKIESPFYEKFEKDAYKIDYVPKEEPDGIAETMEVQFYLFLNILLNGLWNIYVFFVEFTIRVVNWAFSKELTNDLIDILNGLFPSLKDTLWDNLWFLGASISILGAILLWGYGKMQRSITVIAGLILLLAVVPSLLANLPSWMKTTNTVATEISAQVMVKMVKAENPNTVSVEDLAELKESDPEKFEQEIAKRNAEWQEDTEKNGIHAVDDAIWKSLVYEPNLVANFGSKKVGKKYFDGLMKQGDNDEKRRDYLRHGGESESYKWIRKDGTAKNKDLKPFTQAGFASRATNTLVTIVLGAIPLLALVLFSFLCLYWTGIAMGFAILGVIYLLLAFWPGFGWGEAGHWLYRTFSALLMKVFYAIVLAIFLATWILIQPGGSHMQNLGLGGRIIVIVFLLLGFWTATEALRRKWNSPPGLQGGAIAADGVGANDMGMALGNTKKMAGMVGRGYRSARRLQRHRAHRQNQRQIRDAHIENQAMLQRMETGAGQEPEQRVRLKSGSRHIDSGMSKEAADTYREMKEKEYDPTDKKDRARWIGENPEQADQVAEIGKWSDQELADQAEDLSTFNGSTAPPERPAKNTPEYEVWEQSPRWRQHWGLYQSAKKKVDEHYKRDYRKQYMKYEKSLSRYFRQPPRYIRPSDRAYLKEYRRMLRKPKEEER